MMAKTKTEEATFATKILISSGCIYRRIVKQKS
jgi:hypothetical protein